MCLFGRPAIIVVVLLVSLQSHKGVPTLNRHPNGSEYNVLALKWHKVLTSFQLLEAPTHVDARGSGS